MHQTLKLPCHYIPLSNTKIASAGAVLRTYPGENKNIPQDSMVLLGNPFEQQPSNAVPYCPRMQLPFAVAEVKLGNEVNNIKPKVCIRKLKSSQQMKPIGSLTNSDNCNLSQSKKELLQWHCHLRHIGMKCVQWLFCGGTLSTSKNELQKTGGSSQADMWFTLHGMPVC